MFRVLIACLLMVGTAAKAENIERDLDAIVQSYGEVGIFAGTVLVAHDGKTVYEAAVGLANRETNVPNRANTRFNIGSSHLFAGTVVEGGVGAQAEHARPAELLPC